MHFNTHTIDITQWCCCRRGGSSMWEVCRLQIRTDEHTTARPDYALFRYLDHQFYSCLWDVYIYFSIFFHFQFLQDILDTLFSILDDNTDKYGLLIFQSLVRITLFQTKQFYCVCCVSTYVAFSMCVCVKTHDLKWSPIFRQVEVSEIRAKI